MPADQNDMIVTRFAPSPTGYMHVGGVRTALYSWLFARKHGGKFILRIEDTDKVREVAGSIEHIIESLTWLGLSWDEGIQVGGAHAPYIQSERLDLYRAYAQKLIEKGHAYADPYAEEEVEALRKKAEAEKRPFLYREHRPENPAHWDGTVPLRFRVPEIKRYEWEDLIRGTLSAGEEALDDFIIIKSDGYPTYNFAHVVDDIEMRVTHVMRGEEFISSTPKFLSLYEALGAERPHYATMPVILAPDGKRKLGKRDGAKDILEYRNEGFIPEALLNFLAFTGWNPGDTREVMSVEELIEAFSLERVHSAGASFNETKLRWYNHEHLKRLSAEGYAERLAAFMRGRGEEPPLYLPQAAHLLQERAATLLEAALLINAGEIAFFEDSSAPVPALLMAGAKADPESVKGNLETLVKLLDGVSEDRWNAETIKDTVFPYATERGRASVLWPMRIALARREQSPDPFTIAELIGKKKTLSRIAEASQNL